MVYLWSLFVLAASALDRTWTFDADAPDKPPAGFYFDTTNDRPDGQWRVVQDGAARVLAQMDKRRDERRLALAVVNDFELRHIRLSARIKIVGGVQEQAGGIVWRYRNSENYLVASINTEEKNVRLYRVVDGNRVRFGGEEHKKLELNRWHTLRIEHRGQRIKVYVDDEMLFDERDRHFNRAGRIGLWTRADSVVYFDDLRAQDLDDDRSK
jgi:hypothetical protein